MSEKREENSVIQARVHLSVESNDELRTAVRCLPALAMVPSSDVDESFLILADSMPDHEKMPELLSYFEHTYIRGRRRPGRGENYGSAIFPIESWNHYEAGAGCIARTTNAVEGWHFGLQVLFNATTRHCGLSYRELKKTFKCNVQRFCKELLVLNLLFQCGTRH
ncbi:unnamed protein product [Clavelina lepadiformis]|uniref:Uncharacterized protein n=1 Tax=Clavelina lepadiformis TaxID=159417 RepID=A0ABP0FG46_CLALP